MFTSIIFESIELKLITTKLGDIVCLNKSHDRE